MFRKSTKTWERGQHVAIEVVDLENCHDREVNDFERNNQCDEPILISNVKSSDDNPPPNFTTKNHLDIDKYLNINKLPADLNADKLPADFDTDGQPTS